MFVTPGGFKAEDDHGGDIGGDVGGDVGGDLVVIWWWLSDDLVTIW